MMTSGLPDIDLNLMGRTALVTGGSNEISGAICRVMASAGASVIIHYNKNREIAEQTCKDIISSGGTAVTFSTDFSDEDSIDALFSFIKERFNHLDILVNNAHLPLKRTFLKDITWEEHQEQIDVMVKGTFYCSKKAIEMMREPVMSEALTKDNENEWDKNVPPILDIYPDRRGFLTPPEEFSGKQRKGGSIINILTSQTEHPVSGYSSYVTAASALTGFTRNLAVEAGCMGVRVNMIAPNFVLTSHTPNAPQHVHDAIIKSTPLGRLATPNDIAKVVLFFASDLSEFITGCYFVVDGGYGLSGRR
ncbi:MAG: SDR family oxidoreductase [Nitrospirae bacterium]|nr:SDR family oxidoreductase [Nitrospirota bacterium]